MKAAPSLSQWRAASIGCSKYTVSLSISPWTRRTQRPSLMSIAGMISIFLIRCYKAPKIGENAQPDFLALLRMELAGKKMLGRDTRDKRGAVIGDGGYYRRILRHNIKRMDEVNVVAAGKSLEER